jgi:AcrR family transcriptional regulator
MTRSQKPALRRAILDEARRVLLAHGYTGLSMRRIAAAVGCTATSIYLYYSSKDALIHALIDEGMERLHTDLLAAAEAVPDPRLGLARLCECYIDYGLENPEYYEVMFMLHPSHMERFPAEMYRRARRNLDMFADALGAVLGHDPVAAPDAPRDPALVAASTLVWTSLHGLVSLLVAERVDTKTDRQQLIDQAVRHATAISESMNPDSPASFARTESAR